MHKCYHLSPIKNRESILNEGLKLQSGERSKRFGQHDERLYVVDRLWKVLRLVNCTMFNTHPDFKNGFDLYEVEVKDKNVDEKWELGSFTTITPRNVKYCCTIEIGEGKGIIVRRTNREQLLSIRRGEYDYDTLITEAEDKIKKMDEIFEKSNLPDKIDFEFVNSLLLKIRKMWYKLE